MHLTLPQLVELGGEGVSLQQKALADSPPLLEELGVVVYEHLEIEKTAILAEYHSW